MDEISIELAVENDAAAVITLFDQSLLAFDRATITPRIEREAVVIARTEQRLCGAHLNAGRHVEAIAVRPSHRNRGVGRAMLKEMADRRGPLTASCREQVRPFFESLGWSTYELPNGRYFCYESKTPS